MALPTYQTYLGNQVNFTPEEAARYGVAECRPDESGRGADYEPHGGTEGDGALRFHSPAQNYEIKISVKPGVPLTGMLLVEADVKGVGIGDGVHPWNGAKVMMPFTRRIKRQWNCLRFCVLISCHFIVY